MDGFLAIGTLNRRYYEALGVPAHKITLVPYTVDNKNSILCQVGEPRPAQKSLLPMALIQTCQQSSTAQNSVPERTLSLCYALSINFVMETSAPIFLWQEADRYSIA